MTEYFPEITSPILFEGPDSRNPLSFKHYDANATVAGKTMADHLRFSVAYWHSFKGDGQDMFGPGTFVRPWNNASDTMKQAEMTLDAAFEFFVKLGVGFYCFHDRDLAPEGDSFAESCNNLEKLVKMAGEKQKETGVKLLWGTANLFSNPRYMNGAATNPDPHVFAYAAGQVKHAIAATKELGGENYVFWGAGRL